MLNLQTILGGLAVLVGFAAYVFYFRDIFLGKTKPHAFSWLIWSILIGTAFFAQFLNYAGPGAWVTGFSAVMCFSIFLFALKKGEKNFTLGDKLGLGAASIALLLWYFTKNPLTSIFLIILVDVLGYVPTFRKSFFKPYEETVLTYFLAGFKFFFALLALKEYSLITALYPVYLLLSNGIFAGFLWVRRKQLKKSEERFKFFP